MKFKDYEKFAIFKIINILNLKQLSNLKYNMGRKNIAIE
jgi:hypothetical protein